MIASDVDDATPLVAQEGAVWWIDRLGNGVTRIVIGAPQPTQVVGLNMPTSFAVDGSSFFWLDNDGVGSCSLPACADRQVLAPGEGPGSDGSLIVDQDHVYWSDREGIFACPRTGCPAGGPVTLGTGELIDVTSRHALAVDADRLYWVRLGGTAVSIPKRGGSPRVIATGGPRYPGSVAIDDEAIYWIGCNDVFCSVMRAPLAGGPATALDTLKGTMYDLTVDQDSLYYTANVGAFDATATVDDTGIVKRIDKRAGASGSATLLAQQESDPGAIAVDANYVYWATASGSGSVKRIAK